MDEHNRVECHIPVVDQGHQENVHQEYGTDDKTGDRQTSSDESDNKEDGDGAQSHGQEKLFHEDDVLLILLNSLRVSVRVIEMSIVDSQGVIEVLRTVSCHVTLNRADRGDTLSPSLYIARACIGGKISTDKGNIALEVSTNSSLSSPILKAFLEFIGIDDFHVWICWIVAAIDRVS